MEQINTLLDQADTVGSAALSPELRLLYGGDLRFPSAQSDRPYVISNFVSTLDGVVSFGVPEKSLDGDISGFDGADRFIMGLLRASADAVIVGAATLREVGMGYLWLAENIYPEAQELYTRYRQRALNKTEPPVNVIVSGSGAVDLRKAVFRTPGLKTVVVTSSRGRELLERNGVSALASTDVRVPEMGGDRIAPGLILKLLSDEFGVRLLLHEGGPTLFGDFVARGCMDELFLTIAPQFAGRDLELQRPGVISGTAFLQETAPWLKIVSVKQRGDHLYLRYATLPSRAG